MVIHWSLYLSLQLCPSKPRIFRIARPKAIPLFPFELISLLSSILERIINVSQHGQTVFNTSR